MFDVAFETKIITDPCYYENQLTDLDRKMTHLLCDADSADFVQYCPKNGWLEYVEGYCGEWLVYAPIFPVHSLTIHVKPEMVGDVDKVCFEGFVNSLKRLLPMFTVVHGEHSAKTPSELWVQHPVIAEIFEEALHQET